MIITLQENRTGIFLTVATFILTLNLLMTTIVAPPRNASKWQMGFNSAFKGLKKVIRTDVLT